MGLSTLAPFFFIHPDFLLHVVSTTSFAQLGWCSQSSLPTCRSWPFHSLHQVVSTISFCTARMLLIRRSCARLPVPSPRPLSAQRQDIDSFISQHHFRYGWRECGTLCLSEMEGAGDAKPFGLESDGVGPASAENNSQKVGSEGVWAGPAWVLKL